MIKECVCVGKAKQAVASKRSTVGHVTNQASRLHCESGVPTSTLSKPERGGDEEAREGSDLSMQS